MKVGKLLLYALVVAILSSCAAAKQVPYFQDIGEKQAKIALANAKMVRLKPLDKIFVQVSGKDSRLTAPYNVQTTGSSGGGHREIGYTVDQKGFIDFPGLGELYVEGLTRMEVASKIKNILIERQLLKDPVVFVEFMNLSYIVLGDMGSSRYSIDRDEITILEAIAQAGDLQISGLRENVLVLREVDGVMQSYRVDLTSAKNVMSSPVYYLQQDDIIYVEQNKMKRNSASANGNTLSSIGFWMGIPAFLVSLASIALSFIK